MNRRNFLHLIGCGCLSMSIHSCTTAPITERKQLRLIPEAKLNAQAAQIYEKIKKKEKLIDDKNLTDIKTIGKKMQDSISEYFYQSNFSKFISSFSSFERSSIRDFALFDTFFGVSILTRTN